MGGIGLFWMDNTGLLDILLTSDLRADALVLPTVRTGLMWELPIWRGCCCWGFVSACGFGGGIPWADCSGADLGWVNCRPLAFAFDDLDVDGASTSMITGSLVLVTLTTAAESDVMRCC